MSNNKKEEQNRLSRKNLSQKENGGKPCWSNIWKKKSLTTDKKKAQKRKRGNATRSGKINNKSSVILRLWITLISAHSEDSNVQVMLWK